MEGDLYGKPTPPNTQRFNADSRPLGVAAYSLTTEPTSHVSHPQFSQEAYLRPSVPVLPPLSPTPKSDPLTSTSRSSYSARDHQASPSKPYRKFNEESSTSPFTGRSALDGETTTRSTYGRYDPQTYSEQLSQVCTHLIISRVLTIKCQRSILTPKHRRVIRPPIAIQASLPALTRAAQRRPNTLSSSAK